MSDPMVTHPLSIGVLVDLEWGVRAGGHVKCWERFAEAASQFPETLELTVYFLGDRESVVELTPQVRYHIIPPRWGTKRFPWLKQGGGDTDLAGYNRRLVPLLKRHQILHATGIFTFAQTARRVAKRFSIPLVSSIHTDLPKFTQVYSREIISRFIGEGWLYGLFFHQLRIDEWLAAWMGYRLSRFLADCRWVLISKPEDRQFVLNVIPPDRISQLRRGVDKDRFHPHWRDRLRLESTFGIDPSLPVALFVGRVDDSKNVMTMASAVRKLLDQGYSLHGFIIGEGASQSQIQALLGRHVTLTGQIPQSELPWLYASSDLFVFPSESEVSPNVVIEAKASGLPVFISSRDGGAQFIQFSGLDGVLVDDPDPMAWAEAIAPYLAPPLDKGMESSVDDRELQTTDAILRRYSMGTAARHTIDQVPHWSDVLTMDLLPVWEHVWAEHQSTHQHHHKPKKLA